MTFLAPYNLAWLSLLVPLVVLYILKRRRQERTVGSTLLWEQALRDLRAERPWKKLTPQVSLLLQALIIIAGSIALARPAGAGRAPQGSRLAVVIDVSASMAARDGEQTRIARAAAIGADLARGLPPGGEMMIVEASAEPVVRAPFERNATALERALESLTHPGHLLGLGSHPSHLLRQPLLVLCALPKRRDQNRSNEPKNQGKHERRQNQGQPARTRAGLSR